MFIWTNVMAPGVTLIFFFVGLIFVLYSFATAFRGVTHRWDDMECPPPPGFGPSGGPWSCLSRTCQTRNPPHARFCRMCGRRHE